jgi:type III secretion protein L
MVVWLRRDKEGIAIPDGIIRRDDWLHVGSLDESFLSIEAQRAAILDEAREQAERILEAASEQADQIRQDAEESAHRLYDEAYESARQSAIDEWAAALLNSSLETHKQLRQQRERMARIVLAAVEKIVPLQDSQGTYRQVLSRCRMYAMSLSECVRKNLPTPKPRCANWQKTRRSGN